MKYEKLESIIGYISLIFVVILLLYMADIASNLSM